MNCQCASDIDLCPPHKWYDYIFSTNHAEILVMRRSMVYPLGAFVSILIVAGCERVGAPWDSSGYFKEERVRTAAAQKDLRDRLMHTQNETEIALHQTDYPR